MPGPLLPLLLLALAGGCGADAPAGAPAANAVAGATASPPEAPLPTLSGRVVDDAELLAPAVEAELTTLLGDHERQTRDQLVVVTTPSLGGETIEAFGRRLGNGWGIGQSELDNGVLLIIAPAERRVRIEVGAGLEGLLTDARAAAIVDDILPALAAGRYEEAATGAVARIRRTLLEDRRRPMPAPARKAA